MSEPRPNGRAPEGLMAIRYREASPADVGEMERIRADDPAGPADPRMERYLKGQHHPQQALLPRVGYVALDGQSIVGYIAGHLTRRYGCDGELQYLYVSREQRRRGVASGLLRRLAGWFTEQGAARICVDVEPGNTRARAFYTSHGATDLSEYWLVWSDIAAVLRAR